MTGRQDDRQGDRQRTLDKYMIDYVYGKGKGGGDGFCWRPYSAGV